MSIKKFWYYYNDEDGRVEPVPVQYKTVTGVSPLTLSMALAMPLKSLVQYGKVATSDGHIYCNNGEIVAVDDELPVAYRRIESITYSANTYYVTNEKLYGTDTITITCQPSVTSGQNMFGAYKSADALNYSLYAYGTTGSSWYFRYGETLYRPKTDNAKRTLTVGPGSTSGFSTNVDVTLEEFETDAVAWIGGLPNSTSPKYSGTLYGEITVGNRLKYVPCERLADGVIGYYEVVNGVFLEPVGDAPVAGEYDDSHLNSIAIVGTAEVLTLDEQTATVPNLFATDDVADEVDIITGVVTRRTAVTASAGVITITALAEPVQESIQPQPLTPVEGTNTVTATATDVTDIELAAEFAHYSQYTVTSDTNSVSFETHLARAIQVPQFTFAPYQDGVPSPDNILPFLPETAYSGVTLNVNGTDYDYTFTSGFFFGSVNPTGGTYKGYTEQSVTFDGTENWQGQGSADSVFFYLNITNGTPTVGGGELCTHFSIADIKASTTEDGFCIYKSGVSYRWAFRHNVKPDISVSGNLAAWKQFLADQYAAGTPVRCIFKTTSGATRSITRPNETSVVGKNTVSHNIHAGISAKYYDY